MDKVRVAVVDDHPLFRQGVVHVLTCAGMDVVGEGASAADAIALAQGRLPAVTTLDSITPDVIMLDANIPGGCVAALRAIGDPRLVARVLVLTMTGDEEQLRQVLAIGARGYVLKGVGGHELIAAVRAIACGDGYISPTLAASMMARTGAMAAVRSSRPDPLADLTHRESQVFTLVAQGLQNKEIGRRLDLAEKTVKHYLTKIFEKLQVRNRVEAALLAKVMADSTSFALQPERHRQLVDDRAGRVSNLTQRLMAVR